MRIILFDIDCLRPDHLGCYGYSRPTSPNIDRIARDGMRFNNYYCADSPCMPSRAGFVSGRFGIHNGVVSNLGAGAEFHLRKTNYDGLQAVNQVLPRLIREFGRHETYNFTNFAWRHSFSQYMLGWTGFVSPNLKGGNETAPEVNEPVLAWLKDNAKRENFLLHINYWDAHRWYKMEASWADRFRDTPCPAWPDDAAFERINRVTGPFTGTGQFKNHLSGVPLMPGKITNRAEYEHVVTGYDAAIAYVDHHVGIVLAELDRQGVLDDAVIIFTSDHGDAFGEHGIFTDHVCADECIHRIPLIVRWPGVTKASAASDAMLYNVDFAATLCDMLGAPIPEHWDGLSFAENLKGNAGLDREYLVWGHALYTVQRAVRTRRHLLIRTYDDYGYRSFEPVELYDMQADPYQTQNLRQDQPQTVACLDSLMQDWLQEQLTKPWAICDPLLAVLAERRRGK